MKKFIIVLICSFSFIKVSYALKFDYLDNSGIIQNKNTKEKFYPSLTSLNNKDYYWLSPAQKRNLNYDNYYEVDINDTNIDKKVLEYVAFKSVALEPDLFSYSNSDYKLYYVILQMLIWSYLDNNNYEMIFPTLKTFVQRKDKFIEKINNIIEGPEFIKNVQSQKLNETICYESGYLNYFYVESTNGVNAEINGNCLNVSGNISGLYNVNLKRKSNGLGIAKIYTDGSAYLVTEGDFPDKTYTLNIEIDYYNLQISSQEDNCYSLVKDNILIEDICVKSESSYLKLPSGNYNVLDMENRVVKSFNLNKDLSIEINPIIKEDVKEEVEVTKDEQITLPKEEQESIIIEEKLENKEEEIIEKPIIIEENIENNSDNDKNEEIKENPNTSFEVIKYLSLKDVIIALLIMLFSSLLVIFI